MREGERRIYLTTGADPDSLNIKKIPQYTQIYHSVVRFMSKNKLIVAWQGYDENNRSKVYYTLVTLKWSPVLKKNLHP